MERYDFAVRYSEVDKMGRAYNAHYLTWFELGRTDYFRKKNIVYSDIEEKRGLFLPVRESYVKYKKPLFYDDDCYILTECKLIDKYRIKFSYKIFNQNKSVCSTGYSVHVFINKSGEIQDIPVFFKEAL